MSEIKSQIDLSQIRYSMVWEDEHLLTKNLEITPDSRVLSIGSAGCNSFSLLLKEPQEMHIVDMSPAQMALIRLKIAAIAASDCRSFLELFGYLPSQNRKDIFNQVAKNLTQEDKDFWTVNWTLVENGLCEQGRLEKFFQYFREKYLHAIWPPEFRARLLQCKTPKEQTDLIDQSQTKPALEKAATEYFGRQGLEKGRDPAQMKYVTQTDIGRRFYRLFIERLNETLVRENFFLFYFIEGHFQIEKQFLPDYLQEKNYAKLRTLLDRIQMHENDLLSVLQNNTGFTDFNLSDIFEYMSQSETGSVMTALAEHSSQNASLAYWTLLVDRKPMTPWQAKSHKGHDRLWFYENFFYCKKA